MEAFKAYLIDEYKDRAKGYVAVEFRFAHGVNVKKDKQSNTPLKIDIIKVSIRFVDKDMNTLFTTNISFENNVIPKNKQKMYINISPKELNNKFGFAKGEIINIIMNDYIDKRDELMTKINNLQTYSGGDNDIIKPQFKGEVVNVVDNDDVNDKPIKKVKFEM